MLHGQQQTPSSISAVSPPGCVGLSSLQADDTCNVQRSPGTWTLACCGCAAIQAPVKHPSLPLDLQQSQMAAAYSGREMLMSQPHLWCFPETSRTSCLTVRHRGTLGRMGRPGATSALLDNVAPAGVPSPHRPPSRQPHVNGSSLQGRAGAASGVMTEPNEDPWRASREGLSSSESSSTNSPAQWIALHDASQVSSRQLDAIYCPAM